MYINDFFEPRAEEQTHILHGVPKVLNTEHALQLYSGETLLHSFVCSPCQLGELCAGWLLTEGYGGNAVTVSPEGNLARVEGAASFPATLKAQSPTICHTSPEEMLALFNSAADKHARTHGIHECVIKGTDWQVICTDIAKDGMLQGPSFDLYARLQATYPDLDIIVSGGISAMSDIHRLDEMHLRHVIVGKAIYEGRITLEEIEKFTI